MKRKAKYTLLAIVAAATIGLFSAAGPSDFKLGQNIEMLINMFRDLNLYYVDEVDPDKMMRDAAYGMVQNLDPYTQLIPAEEMKNFEFMTTGKYGGIGALIRKKDDYVAIAEPYKGFPADRAGLQIGDKIVAINGQDAKGMSTEEVSNRLKGDPGSTVKLKVKRFYTGEEETVNIRRERIAISGVPYSGYATDSIGFIVHSDFTEGCADDLRRAIMQLRSQGQLKGIILDYRSNGGGILQEAVKIVSLFVPKGTQVVTMRGKNPATSHTYTTESEPIDTTTPIVVLVNGETASAAEIVAGALQDLDRAVLIGNRTFGKGLVQSTRPLGYDAYLKLTTAKYYIPSGRCIQRIDYSHRNPEGNVENVPDSLIREYHTRAGRKVYDGGGIMPDIRLDPEYVSRFALLVYGKGYIDDYVDTFMLKNVTREIDIDNFHLTDADYADFCHFIEGKELGFQSETQQALKLLREKAEQERYLEDIRASLDEIEKGLPDDNASNLTIHREELSQLLEGQIILRRHYADGVIRHNLPEDRTVQEAIRLIDDPTRYQQIITEQDTERK